ncbi:Uncharacterised protein [Escherichia coli]|uniref:hypothetical protein n=1 Tax=Escherichia coli TaxID=562 RepID=UPI00191B35C0|nr:hypothetical protein [Escherichia coli]CAD6175548.1 Uncharacterised protein [Escherichia coli]
MGYYENEDVESWDDLPDESVIQKDHLQDINDLWLETASEEDQEKAMSIWFHSRYWDPSNDTPYCSREGGYMYINGGPYDPNDVLCERFEGVVSYDVIERLKDKLYNEVGDEWAKIDHGYDADDCNEYNENLDIEVSLQRAPLINLESRINECESVLNKNLNDDTQVLIRNMVYGASISALEAFLWETMRYWVEHDETVLKRVIVNTDELANQTFKLKEICESPVDLKLKVAAYLQNLVWHRWDKVMPLFIKGIGITMPKVDKLKTAVLKRHDIIHRSGMNHAGEIVMVTFDDASELLSEIRSFCRTVDVRITERF